MELSKRHKVSMNLSLTVTNNKDVEIYCVILDSMFVLRNKKWFTLINMSCLVCAGAGLVRESPQYSSNCLSSIPRRCSWKWTWTNARIPPRCRMSARCPLLSSIADVRDWATAKVRIQRDWNPRFSSSMAVVMPMTRTTRLQIPYPAMYETPKMPTTISSEWFYSLWFCFTGISTNEKLATDCCCNQFATGRIFYGN